MKRSEIREELIKDVAGGNYYLLFDYLLDLSKKSKSPTFNVTQEQLATNLNRTRQSIKKGLKHLKSLNYIDYKYNQITILIEVSNG